MLRAILNKSCRQHPTRHELYGHLPPIMKTIQVRRTRHTGHCWRSRNELISDVLLWTHTHGREKSRTTSTNIHSATMWGYGMLSRRPAWGDERYGKVAREGQGYPCYQHYMMMMMIYLSIYLSINHFLSSSLCLSLSLSLYIYIYIQKCTKLYIYIRINIIIIIISHW